MKIVVADLETNLRQALECPDINVSFILSRPVKIIIDCPGCWSERICKERLTHCGFLEAKE